MERRERCFRNLTFVLFTLFSLWISLQFLAPLALSENSVQDLSGLVAVSDNDYTINNMDFPWSFVYSAGDRLCHQKAERSFFVNGNQMPFCSRCTAIWLGLAVGLGFMVFYRIELNERFVFAINTIRVITGLLIGVLCGVAIGVILDEIKTLNIFKNNKK